MFVLQESWLLAAFSGEETELKRNAFIMKPAEGGIYMNIILRHSLEKQLPIDIIYMKKDGSISKRTIIVKKGDERAVTAFCCTKRQMRTFLTGSILSCAFASGGGYSFLKAYS
ncbi:hypothetical protein EBA29_01779 [Bacillus velezensis]|nr:hypothetical protein EBA29_01779 [Bacillus velezensis]